MENRTVPALLVELVNDQVSSAQRKGIAENLHQPFCQLYHVESSHQSMKDFWEQRFYSLAFAATSIPNVI